MSVTMQWSKVYPGHLICAPIGGLAGDYVEFIPLYRLLWTTPNYRR